MGNSNETADWEDLEVRINLYFNFFLKIYSRAYN